MLKDVKLDSIASLVGVVFIGSIIFLVNKFILTPKRFDPNTTNN